MNAFQKSLLVFLSTILLLSQVHISVYAIHCLCTGETHFALTAEKECHSDECQSDAPSCCEDSSEVCELGEGEWHGDKTCHAPKGALELGIDLDGALVNNSLSELDQQLKGFDIPLYLLFSSLKILPAEHSALGPDDPEREVKPRGFRYLLNGEMLC